MLTAARLRSLLDYNPRTGVFTWRINGRGRYMRTGTRAGTIRKDGYRQICVDRVIYLSGRLAWLYMTDRLPHQLIDHENRKRADDRWKNLREANYSQNGANSKGRNTLGIKGVIFIPPKGTQRLSKPYHARIKVNYRFLHLGSFKTAREAHAAYIAAAHKYFGTFART
jgi:hypothetical protein